MTTTAPRIRDRYPSRLTDAEPRLVDRDVPTVADTAAQADGPLTAAQVEAFARDGFLFLTDVFGPAEVAAHHDELDRLREDPAVRERPETVAEPDTDAVRSIFAVHRLSGPFDAMSRDDRLIGVVRQLHGSEVTLHQTRVNAKPGFGSDGFYWHSDFETWHAEDGMPTPRCISASVALTDNLAHNGPLMVMPGSHETFVQCAGATPEDNHLESLQRQEAGTPSPDQLATLADEHGIVAPTGPAGSVLFFDSNLMHGSNGNITPYARSNAFFVYNRVDNALVEPFATDARRPDHVAHREVVPVG
ncbi:ectoine hydroxylase [Salsipaludibacter albus]|uniref:ectoine hydroxylase n=1 Tax=Salsipaludibacter albus TaxID=2849650 RepID=UPI001EE4303C|nr:ectoine hydroxylase [Salsipaludibacter albus]MBY5162854.1 ectoine hydroxylase [Salsipaludibacter albus]